MSTKPKDIDAEEEQEGEKDNPKMPSKDSGVTVSEDFQQKAHQLLHKATKHEVSHARSKMNDRDDEIRKEEMADENKGKKGGKGNQPEEFSTESAPPGVDV